MGMIKDNNEHETSDRLHRQEPGYDRALKSCMMCLFTFVMSMAGALVLWYWECEYHATNSQLWMVPFGLIFLVTPVMVWFALVVSEGCKNTSGDDQVDIEATGSKSQPSHRL